MSYPPGYHAWEAWISSLTPGDPCLLHDEPAVIVEIDDQIARVRLWGSDVVSVAQHDELGPHETPWAGYAEEA